MDDARVIQFPAQAQATTGSQPRQAGAPEPRPPLISELRAQLADMDRHVQTVSTRISAARLDGGTRADLLSRAATLSGEIADLARSLPDTEVPGAAVGAAPNVSRVRAELQAFIQVAEEDIAKVGIANTGLRRRGLGDLTSDDGSKAKMYALIGGAVLLAAGAGYWFARWRAGRARRLGALPRRAPLARRAMMA